MDRGEPSGNRVGGAVSEVRVLGRPQVLERQNDQRLPPTRVRNTLSARAVGVDQPDQGHHTPQGEGEHASADGVAPGQEPLPTQSPVRGAGSSRAGFAFFRARKKRRVGWGGSGVALLDEGGGQHDRQAHDKQQDGETGKPARQAETLGQALDDLIAHPGTQQVNSQYLPERPPMDLVKQLLQWRHGPVPHEDSRGLGLV